MVRAGAVHSSAETPWLSVTHTLTGSSGVVDHARVWTNELLQQLHILQERRHLDQHLDQHLNQHLDQHVSRLFCQTQCF